MKYIIFNIFLLLILFISQSQAEYYYTGISNTSPTAYLHEMSAIVYDHPICARTMCHSIVWITLWDRGYSNEFVEAGIGYSPRFNCPDNKSIGLWYATIQFPLGERIDCVKKGTFINISILKILDTQEVLIVWKYGLYTKKIKVKTPKWINNPGIHPTKIEIYSATVLPPSPVWILVFPAPLLPFDNKVIYEQTFPYIAIWKARMFEVNYR